MWVYCRVHLPKTERQQPRGSEWLLCQNRPSSAYGSGAWKNSCVDWGRCWRGQRGLQLVCCKWDTVNRHLQL